MPIWRVVDCTLQRFGRLASVQGEGVVIRLNDVQAPPERLEEAIVGGDAWTALRNCHRLGEKLISSACRGSF